MEYHFYISVINNSPLLSLHYSQEKFGVALQKSRGMKIIDFSIIFIILSAVVFATEARLLEAKFLMNNVKAGAIRGKKHENTKDNSFGVIKDSGPSPGEGNDSADAKTFGGVKVSGPSPGAGH
ncbi:hypothetical protein OROHE_019642 [Orobanche hederae]